MYITKKILVHLAVAGDVLMVSYFVLSFFPREILIEICDRIESVLEKFPTYFYEGCRERNSMS